MALDAESEMSDGAVMPRVPQVESPDFGVSTDLLQSGAGEGGVGVNYLAHMSVPTVVGGNGVGLKRAQGAEPGFDIERDVRFVRRLLPVLEEIERAWDADDAMREAAASDLDEYAGDDVVINQGLDDRGLYSNGGRMLGIAAANKDEAEALLEESGLSIRDRADVVGLYADFLCAQPVLLEEDIDDGGGIDAVELRARAQRKARNLAAGVQDKRVRDEVTRRARGVADGDPEMMADILLWEDALGHPDSVDGISDTNDADRSVLRDAGILDEARPVDMRSRDIRGGVRLFAGFAGSVDDIADLLDQQVERVLGLRDDGRYSE